MSSIQNNSSFYTEVTYTESCTITTLLVFLHSLQALSIDLTLTALDVLQERHPYLIYFINDCVVSRGDK